jgi:hypothetical protein
MRFVEIITVLNAHRTDNPSSRRLFSLICSPCYRFLVGGRDRQGRAPLGEAFKYLRKAVGVEPANLADFLDVPVEYIGHWEGGSWPVDPRAHAVLCSFVMGKFEHRPASLDCLGVLREPRKLAQKVRLHLIDAIGQASKMLQFGSAARGAPALA